MPNLPVIKLDRGIHAMHLFYRIDRERWAQLSSGGARECLGRLETLCAANANPSHPRLTTYATIGGKADLAFFLLAAELAQLGQMHRDLEACFSPGVLTPIFSYVSVTELSEYMTTEEENRNMLVEQEKLVPESEPFNQRLGELRERMKKYEHYRLYPEMPDWEVMGFYPMSKRRAGNDNWYLLDFATRRKLMAGHARVGRQYAGRVSQLITGSTGVDDWEWGVTLMAHQLDALKEIVYEMRFDEVSARYGDFGPFFVNMRLQPAELWPHLHLQPDPFPS
ncbi:MAG TPA: hydrogen peroxide-dependent heme synthase [Candidatus Saccharimonadales bacterium]|nr:hydrogen peroxide-dependent heme synthase [Candidatus Saccharimonadales bacterium]